MWNIFEDVFLIYVPELGLVDDELLELFVVLLLAEELAPLWDELFALPVLGNRSSSVTAAVIPATA